MTTLEFGLLCGLICILMIDVILLLGIYKNKDNEISLITRLGNYVTTTKEHNFYYTPIIYKVNKYKLENNIYKIKLDNKIVVITYDIINVKLFHYNKKKIKNYIFDKNNAYQIGIKIK